MNIETLMKVQFPEELEQFHPITFNILEVITQPWAGAFLYRDIHFAVAAMILEHRMRSYIMKYYENEYAGDGTITKYNNFFKGLGRNREVDSFAKKYHDKGFPRKIEQVADLRNQIMHGKVDNNISPQQIIEGLATIEDFCTTFPHPFPYMTAFLRVDSPCPKCKKMVRIVVKNWCPYCKSLFE